MQRIFSTGLKRTFTSSARASAAPAAEAAAPSTLLINFCTPHAPVYKKKAVQSVIVPGANGEYGVTFGHSPIISQLQPGIVQVQHLDGVVEKFFVPGGFAVTQADSFTDISAPEAIPVADIDESLVRSQYAEALKTVAAAPLNSIEKATAQIEVDTLSAMARGVGFVL